MLEVIILCGCHNLSTLSCEYLRGLVLCAAVIIGEVQL